MPVYPGAIQAQSLAVADLNGDGKPDLVVAAYGSQQGSGGSDPGGVIVLLGKGDGTFQTPLTLTLTGLHPEAVAAADLNGDGILDLAVAAVGTPGSPGSLAVFRGTGGGKFSSPQMLPLGANGGTQSGIAVGDLNGDGKPDLAVVSNFSTTVDILLGDGAGGFTASKTKTFTGDGPDGLVIADFDGDGKLDLIIPHCCGESDASYLPGNGDGTFKAEQHLPAGASVTGLAVTHFTGSAGPDVVFVNQTGTWEAPVNNFVAAATFTSKNSASYVAGTVAPNTIGYGEAPNIASRLVVASGTTWPTNLANVHLDLVDSQNQTWQAPIYFVTSGAIGYLVPGGMALGTATAKLTTASGVTVTGTFHIAATAPGLYTSTSNGSGPAAGFAIRVAADGSQTQSYLFDLTHLDTPAPVDLSQSGDVYLSLYGTGFRNATGGVTATVGGVSVPVYGFAAVAQYQGEDLVNIGPLPKTLTSGTKNVVVTFGGKSTNTVTVGIR